MNLIIGSKFSYNDLSGYEYQPSIRLNYSPDATHSLWGAVSRAVKTPTRIEDDLFLAQLAALGPVFAVITGNRRLEAEDLTAFEIGYRVQESEDIAWDISLFWNHYEDLVGLVAAGPPTGLPPSFPLVFRNNARGDAYGFELNGTVQMTDDWQIRAWYSLLQLDNVGEGTNPTNSAYAMSSWNLSEELEFDLIARYVDSLPSQKIDSYFTLDARIGFSPANDLYLSVVGQNLLDSTHPEFRETYALASSSEVRRGVYAQLEWRY
jgi:iron complex outermembrane recepter protein